MPALKEYQPLLRVTDLRKTYSRRRFWEKSFEVKALDGVDLVLESGKTLAVVGKSGSGKTTLAMCVALLEQPDFGKIWFDGRDISSLDRREHALLRPRIQMLFQDSASALPPHFPAARIVEEPLVIQRRYSARERAEIVSDLMARVGLPSGCGHRLAHTFSGGERQRLAIARALVLKPDLVILDEPFTGLDLSIRGRLVNLLSELQQERSLTYLYISHDLDLVHYFSDNILTLDHGKVIDQASVSMTQGASRTAQTPNSGNIGMQIVKRSSLSFATANRTIRYITGRLTQALLLLLAVSFLSFLFLELAPGDFFQEMRLNPQISPNTVARLRAQYGMDQPLLIRYGVWLGSVVSGNFGYSFAYASPAAPLLWVRARNTLLLTATSLSLAWVGALSLGILCAESAGGLLDRVCALGTSVLLAVPELLLGLCFLAVAVRTGWLHVGGMVSPGFEDLGFWEQTRDVTSHLILPAVALALSSLPLLLRHVRSAMLDTLNTPFIRSARGHGIGRFRILLRHALARTGPSVVGGNPGT